MELITYNYNCFSNRSGINHYSDLYPLAVMYVVWTTAVNEEICTVYSVIVNKLRGDFDVPLKHRQEYNRVGLCIALYESLPQGGCRRLSSISLSSSLTIIGYLKAFGFLKGQT